MTTQVLEPVADSEVTREMRVARIVALIPAHNEQDGIVKTVKSILAQTRPPDQVIVMADNCTDGTVPLAREAGATVIETVNNKAKKAGALNQGLDIVLPDLTDDDFILCQDADGELSPDFLEKAIEVYDEIPNLGGLSGAIHARKANNFIERAQAVEYARGTRLMQRQGGKVHVLSGAATVFPAKVFRHVAAARGDVLPGEPGTYFMEDSLTEDFEITLAIRKLGYHCTSTKRCTVVTDVMETLEMLETQRLRWYRGAMESTWLYRHERMTRKIWGGVAFTFFASLLFPAAVLALVYSYLAFDAPPNPVYWFLLPIFITENIVVARRVDKSAVKTAVLFFPLWLYDNMMFIIYWRAFFQAVGGANRVWIT